MKSRRITDQPPNTLRRRAQDCSQSGFVSKRKDDLDAHRLLHELQVHEIELEMQQEQLLMTQAELTDSLSLYTELYDFAPVGYITLDDGGLIENINLTGASMLGSPRSSLIGKSIIDRFTSKQQLLDYLQAACHINSNTLIELQVNTPRATVTDVQLESRHIKNTIELGCKLHTIMTDITERKKLERELQKHRDAMKLVFQKQVAFQTSASIAHNLLQPIAAISAYSEVGLHYLNSDSISEEKLRKVLTGNVEQTDRVGHIIQDLLKFLQTQHEVATESFNLVNLIKEVMDIIKKDEVNEFQYVIEQEQNIGNVLVNALYVEKALGNLVKTSIDATAEVSSSPAKIKINIQKNQDMAYITVKGNAPCLPVDLVNTAFEPLIGQEYPGISMGLAISRALIEANGGQLWLESDINTGTSFHFSLKFAPV